MKEKRKKSAIIYDPPIEVFFEYQYVLSTISDFLSKHSLPEMKPKVSDENIEFLKSLGVVTYKDIFEANKETVKKIYQNKKLFRFLIEAFNCFYECYERDVTGYYGKKAISILINGEPEFLEKPIYLYLAPRMYSRISNAFKRYKKHEINCYRDLIRYINDSEDMISISWVGTVGRLSLYTVIIIDYLYWKHSENI